MKKVAITTLGCKVNQYESSCILDNFLKNNYEAVDFSQQADVYIINTCTVTNRTDFKSRNAIRKAVKFKQINPDVKIIVTGCYSQRESIDDIDGVDLIVDNNKKNNIIEFLKGKQNNFEDIMLADKFSELFTTSMHDKTRAFVKIQDGCDYYCAYCAVPYARGHSRSRKKESVIEQIEILVKNNYKEIVLVGINLGLYGQDLYDDYFLVDLLKDIDLIEGLEIVRLSSIEPPLVTDDIIGIYSKSSKMAPHFHIPLQSGSDTLLKKMGRKYTTKQFRNIIDKIKEEIPNIAIGIDVIVGLPGETEKLFQETYDFLESLEFTYLHVFSYSKRKGTVAAKMKDHVHGDIVKKRSQILHRLSDLKKEEYKENLIEKRIYLRGLVEDSPGELSTALSDHYIRIYNSKNESQYFVAGVGDYKIKDGIKVKDMISD